MPILMLLGNQEWTIVPRIVAVMFAVFIKESYTMLTERGDNLKITSF